jgi:hypothetical protein
LRIFYLRVRQKDYRLANLSSSTFAIKTWRNDLFGLIKPGAINRRTVIGGNRKIFGGVTEFQNAACRAGPLLSGQVGIH